jgi:hypothetical protein
VVSHLRQAIRIKPNYALAYWSLSELAGQGWCQMTEQEIAAVHSLIASGRLSQVDQSVLHFTLGNVLDRQEQWDAAFAHFQQGNSLRREWQQSTGRAFDAAAHREWVDKLIETFDQRFFQERNSSQKGAAVGSASEVPVFVVGMPRSGSTLVAHILSSHPQVVSLGELWEVTEYVKALGQKGAAHGGYPGCARSVKKADLRALANQYLQCVSRLAGPAQRIVDKMPQNFLFLGVINLLFPRARVIDCRRDPLDVCLSCYFQNFNGIEFAWSQEDLGQYHIEYERLMAHWKKVLPIRMMEVRYEDLVARQEEVSRELIAFCGLEWDDRCLTFHKNPRPVRTASAAQVRRPMYNSAVGRWQHYAAHLQPLRQALGL